MNLLSESATKTWQLIQSGRGRAIASLSVLVYEQGGELSWEDTPLQISFACGNVLFLDSMPNGEELRVQLTAWQDPFAGNLTPENQEFVGSYGKWKVIDISTVEPYRSLIGQVIKEINPIVNQFGTFSGVQFGFESTKLYFIVEFDECHIVLEQESHLLIEKGFKVMDQV